jgi:Methyltransferase FkbM domain
LLEKAAVIAGGHATAAFHVASLTGLSGLSNSPFVSDVGVIEVAGISLSAYLTEKGWETVDFIKIDAEGHDLDILRGMDFKAISPRLVMVEFGDHFPCQDRTALLEALSYMKERGYRACVVCLHALGEFMRHEWGTRLLWGRPGTHCSRG